MERQLKTENHNITYYQILNNINVDKLKELNTNSKINH
jgi:hypothetical protein